MKKLQLLVLLAVTPLALAAQQNVIGPNGVRTPSPGDQAGNWVPDQQFGAQIGVTTSNPREGFNGYASGSLEMSVDGLGSAAAASYPAWGFYYRYNDFGLLRELSALSFDWFRSSMPGQDLSTVPTTDLEGGSTGDPVIDWQYKTPVIRLLLGDANGASLGELIWEGYYNQGQLNNAPTPLDQWVTTSNLQADNFWYSIPPSNQGDSFMVGCAPETFNFWQGGAQGSAINQLLGSDCLSPFDVHIIGLGVGVGNNWPLPWHGFVDNVRMGFGQDGLSCQPGLEYGNCALDANFDFTSTVPEPSAWLLLLTGMLGILATGKLQRRRARRHI